MDNIDTSNRLGGIQRVTRNAAEGSDPLAAIVRDVAGTREFRKIISTIMPEMLNLWAGDSISRRTITRPAGNFIRKGFTRPGDILETREIPLLFEDPEFLKQLTAQLPDIVSVVIETATAAARGLATLPAGERAAFIDGLLTALTTENPAVVVNAYVRLINEAHQARPDFLAAALGPAITRFIAETDFGELKDLIETSAGDIAALARVINESLLEHPAKMVLALSFMPTLANIVTGIVKDALHGANTMAPDLLTDVMLSFARELNGESFGLVVNELSELVRKLHTGSALLGEPGAPKFPQEAGRFVKAAVDVIDADLIRKARRDIADGRDTIAQTLLEALKKRPELLVDQIRHSQEGRKRRIRNLGRRLALMTDERSEKEMIEAAAKSAADVDTGEMAEVVNLGLQLFKRIRKNRPNLISALASRFVDSLDMDMVEETIQEVAEEAADALEPLAGAVMPVVVTRVFRWLSSTYSTNDDAVNEARQAVREFLHIEEVTS